MEDSRREWEKDWDGWFAKSAPRCDVLRDDWLARVRSLATSASVEEIPAPVGKQWEWTDYVTMVDVHDEASALRALAADDLWKQPFNRFRGIFVRRNVEALKKFAADDSDPEFWLAFDHRGATE